uniref:Uncharacterized protein n=1 Tax=Rhizophora mucronata TaxID=61149 RepID=A0A2P2IUT6_RHIMU
MVIVYLKVCNSTFVRPFKHDQCQAIIFSLIHFNI